MPLCGSERHVVEKAINDKRSVLSRGTCRPGLVGSYVFWYWVVGDDKAKMDPGVHDPALHISRRVLDGNRKLSHVLIDAYIVNADFFGPLPIFVYGNKNPIHWNILNVKLARLMVCSFSFFLPNFRVNQW